MDIVEGLSIIEGLVLIVCGLFAGFINTVAGGGSLITMPLLIFMGLPSVEANASNRVAIFIQNFFAVSGFRSKGVFVFPFSFYLGVSSTIGAIIGANLAVDIRGELFNRILAVIMLAVVILTVFKKYLSPKSPEEIFTKNRTLLSIIAFFFLGIYGGFIQAGIGFLIIAWLTNVHGLGMAKTNSIKVFAALFYTLFALVVFYLEGKIRWEYGLILAIGNATGAWIASRWSVHKDDKWIRMIMVVTVTGLAVKLWFYG